MKIELIKYFDDQQDRYWWKITNDGAFIAVFQTEEEGITGLDKYVERLKQPKIEPEIIKSITI
jgi:hypothetical protein